MHPETGYDRAEIEYYTHVRHGNAPAGYRSKRRQNSIAIANRHTGKPHEHKREIERRARQN